MKQPVLIPIGSRDHVSLIRLAASLNIDTQDRQDKQDEKLVHKKLTGSMIECAFVENLSVLRGPSRIPFESFPTPWNPFADSSFALLTDPLSPLVEIFSPFPTFGGSLLSFLQPLSGPSSSFVALRGFLFLAFVDNPQLFQVSPAPAPHGGADHTRGKQGTDSWAPVGLSRGRRPDRSPWERGRPARIPSQLSGAASASRKGSNGAVAG